MDIAALKQRYSAFFTLAENTFSERSIAMINDAFERTAMALDRMTRYDGSPLIEHSVRTAEIVISEIGLGRNSTIAALVHDAVRMNFIPISTVREKYGEEPAQILEGLNLISKVDTKISMKQADNFRELIISYSTDPRVILIKLADRLEVMRTLEMFPDHKRRKKSWESMNLYAQIAHKLGLYSIKSELEDISLSYLEPEDYSHIKEKLEETTEERDIFIASFFAPIEEKLRQQGIQFHMKGRTKSVYSIWKKMKRTGVSFEEVYDIFAIRIIVDCPRETEKQVCWNVYSIITDFYTPNPDRLRDWVSIPKSNGYESLHTTVVTKEGRWVEVQIRSERMDEVAERGIAAHWRYKGVHGAGNRNEEWMSRLREIMEETDRNKIPRKLDTGDAASSEEIFVFTPKGDLRKLPKGATVLDFAFDIHTDVGASCVGAKVGDRNVSIREVLKNGDIVSIVTSKNQKPKADWLNVVVTSKAKNKIKACLREEEIKIADIGREELERKIKNWKLNISLDDAVVALCKYYKIKTGTELYGRIASADIDVADLKELIQKHINGELFEVKIPPPPHNTEKSAPQNEDAGGDALIIEDAIKGLDYKMGKCCNPIFGDDIFGFTTISSGITIHRNDCPNAKRLKEMYPYRVLPARWRSNAANAGFIASIRVVAEDTAGMVNRITETIAGHRINIRSMNLLPMRDNRIGGIVNIEVPNTAIVDTISFTLLKVKGVEKAYRVAQ